MQQKQCIKCKNIKNISQFNFKNKITGRRNARCKTCTRRDIRKAYYKKREYYVAYRYKRNEMIRSQIRKFVYGYLSIHSCVDCGVNDPIILQFDHVRGVKKESVSYMANSRRFSLQDIVKEIEKCEVRCANCHTRKTALERGYYVTLIDKIVAI